MRFIEQAEELMLKNSAYELLTLELMADKIEFDNWILPKFLRVKDLSFENPIYAKAFVRKNEEQSVLGPWRERMKVQMPSAPKKKPMKKPSAFVNQKKTKRSEDSPNPKHLNTVPTDDEQHHLKLKEKQQRTELSHQAKVSESDGDSDKNHGGNRSGIRSAKTTTGIVGLPYDPRARETLTANLLKIKELMTELVPDTAYYRQRTLKDVDEKLQLLKEHENDEALEDALGFQLEQVISMTEDEIKLIPFMAEQKPWDVPQDYEVQS
eukprot:g1268.t1